MSKNSLHVIDCEKKEIVIEIECDKPWIAQLHLYKNSNEKCVNIDIHLNWKQTKSMELQLKTK